MVNVDPGDPRLIPHSAVENDWVNLATHTLTNLTYSGGVVRIKWGGGENTVESYFGSLVGEKGGIS